MLLMDVLWVDLLHALMTKKESMSRYSVINKDKLITNHKVYWDIEL